MAARLPKSQSRKLIVPEVIQSSAMDCGPAALKSLLGGYDIQVSYGRLREACQTDIDGTSIDSIEVMAQELGLEAEQIMIPRDHLLVTEARTLPAIVVTRLPNGSTHFVVVWRRHGQYLQVMDPSIGRRWSASRSSRGGTFARASRRRSCGAVAATRSTVQDGSARGQASACGAGYQQSECGVSFLVLAWITA